MKFRDTPVDGFFCIHSKADGVLLTQLIEQHLEFLEAEMQDVQYSTHLTQDGSIMNDVLVMYCKKEHTAEDLDEQTKMESWI